MLFPHSKLQGEWAEACFAAEALRRGFIVSKPLGDSAPYDFVLDWRGPRRRYRPSVTPSGVRRSRTQSRGSAVAFAFPENENLKTKNSKEIGEKPRSSAAKLVRIQVKSVSVRNPPQGIYHVATMRSVATAKKPYAAGDFDFLAAFIISRRLWYIIPAREIVGIKMISLCPGHSRTKRRSRKRAFGCHSERSRGPRRVAILDAMGWRSEESAFFRIEKRETRNGCNRPHERTTFRKRRLEQYRNAWRLLCGQ